MIDAGIPSESQPPPKDTVPPVNPEPTPTPSGLNKPLSRRGFLRGMAGVLSALVLSGSHSPQSAPPAETQPAASEPVSPKNAAAEATSSVEVMREPYAPALLIGIRPQEKNLIELKKQGILRKETQPFDFSVFLEKTTGAPYQELESQFQQETGSTESLASSEGGGFQWLIAHGHQKEAVSLGYAQWLSMAARDTGSRMHQYRSRQNEGAKNTGPSVDMSGELGAAVFSLAGSVGLNGDQFDEAAVYLEKQHAETEKSYQELAASLTKEELELYLKAKQAEKEMTPDKYSQQPAEMVGIEQFFKPLNELGLDNRGNAQYEFVVDEQAVSDILKQSSDTIVALTYPVGPVRLTLGVNVPSEDLDDPQQGWVGGDIRELLHNRLGMYLGIQSYVDKSSIMALDTLASQNPDKFIIAAGANNGGDISPFVSQERPQANNFAIAAEWNNLGNKPYADFTGPTDLVSFIDAEVNNNASGAAETVAEWLVEQQANPDNARQMLNEHARDFQGKSRVLDFSSLPYSPDWNNPEMYKKVE